MLLHKVYFACITAFNRQTNGEAWQKQKHLISFWWRESAAALISATPYPPPSDGERFLGPREQSGWVISGAQPAGNEQVNQEQKRL